MSKKSGNHLIVLGFALAVLGWTSTEASAEEAEVCLPNTTTEVKTFEETPVKAPERAVKAVNVKADTTPQKSESEKE